MCVNQSVLYSNIMACCGVWRSPTFTTTHLWEDLVLGLGLRLRCTQRGTGCDLGDSNSEPVINSDIKMCCIKVETHPFNKKVKDWLMAFNRIISSSHDVIVKFLVTTVHEFNMQSPQPTGRRTSFYWRCLHSSWWCQTMYGCFESVVSQGNG